MSPTILIIIFVLLQNLYNIENKAINFISNSNKSSEEEINNLILKNNNSSKKSKKK
jgi:hypothetical protein